MGGGTGTGGCRYETMTLDQPWGEEETMVRIFPPCEVKDQTNRSSSSAIIFRRRGKDRPLQRKSVGWMDWFPSDGFVAWDDTNKEYAWHEVGTIDVPKAVDPRLLKDNTDDRARIPVIPTTTIYRRKRRSLRDWFLSKSRANDVPDFLRKDNT